MAKLQHKYTGPEKAAVIERMHRDGLGIMEAARLYNIPHQRISDWERLYLQKGREGLLAERRGRPKRALAPAPPAGPQAELLARVCRLEQETARLRELIQNDGSPR